MNAFALTSLAFIILSLFWFFLNLVFVVIEKARRKQVEDETPARFLAWHEQDLHELSREGRPSICGWGVSYHEYLAANVLLESDPPFYALIMAAMHKADTANTEKLKLMWPDVWTEIFRRYNAPGGLLEGEALATTLPRPGSEPPQTDSGGEG